MIDRKKIYEEVKYLVKDNWGNLILAFVIIMVINGLLGSILDQILPTVSLAERNLDQILFSSNFDSFIQSAFETPLIYSLIKTFINSFASFIFSGALSISVLEFVREKYEYRNKRFTVDKFLKNLSIFAPKLILVSLIMTLINTALSFIPFVGFIITILLSVIFAFVVFVIPDNPDASGFDYFRLSIDETRGIRKDIILLTLKYWLLPFGVFFAGLILSVVTLLGDSLIGFPILILTIILFIILILRATILQNIALSVLYDINNSGEESYHYDEYENRFSDEPLDDPVDYDRSNYNKPYLNEDERNVLYKDNEDIDEDEEF